MAIVCDFTSDINSGLAPVTVNFTFTGSSDLPITTYLWTFDDGQTSSQENPSHSFIRGTYKITLFVSDGFESDTITKINFVDSYSNGVFDIDTVQKLQLIGSPGDALTLTPGLALHDSYVQTTNIDASDTSTWNAGAGFIPIGLPNHVGTIYNVFSGTYDGAGYNITGLYIHTSVETPGQLYSTGYTGLFALCDAAEFSNINLLNVNMYNPNSGSYLGCIICNNIQFSPDRIIVDNCYVEGIISGYNVGGLVCFADYFDIIDCSSEVIISATDSSAGIIYYASNCILTNCSSTCTINSTGGYSGGIGSISNNTQIENCHVVVDITTQYSAGGIFSYLVNSIINNCSSEGVISGVGYCAGISGYTYLSGNCTNVHSSCEINAIYYAAGLFAYYNGQQYSLTDSYSTGNITCIQSGSSIGGLIGSLQNGDYIANCYAIGNVICTGLHSQVGGFAGYASGNIIENCYCTGNVTGGVYVGGFIGYNNSSIRISNCNCTGIVTSVELSPYYVGGFAGYFYGTTIIDCYTRSNIISLNIGYYVGGFSGYLSISDRLIRCCALGNISASNMVYAGGFAGFCYGGLFSECFSHNNLTCTEGSGFVSQANSSFYNSFCQTNLTYHSIENSKKIKGTECQVVTDYFCRQVVSDSPTIFTMTNSVSGMNVLWHVNTESPRTYYDSFDVSIYDKTEFRILFDFTVKNCGDNSSIIDYTYQDYSDNMVTGFQVKMYRADYITLPEGVEIYAVHEGTSTLIFSQVSSYNQKFSLICEKLGFAMNFYINSVLISTYYLNSSTGNEQNQVLVLGGNESGGIATEYEISKIQTETRYDPVDVYIAGFVGSMSTSNFFSRCYSAGQIVQQ